MLKVQEVTKSYGKAVAVDEISFEGKKGEIIILLGPNGAGKSTILKCIAGLLKYDGKIEIGGQDVRDMETKKILGYIPETAAVYNYLTIQEHMDFIAKAYMLEDHKEYERELFKRFQLEDKKDKLGKELTKGMEQKLSICCGIIPKPKLLLFDEPMIGLDPAAIKELKDLFVELKEEGSTVLISTHIIDTIKDVWDKILIMKEGKIISTILKEEVEDNAEIEDKFFAAVGGVE